MSKKLTSFQKNELLDQAREARDAHFEEEKHEFWQPYQDAKKAYDIKRIELQALQNADDEAYITREDGSVWKPEDLLLGEYQEEMKAWVKTPEARALKQARSEAYQVWTTWQEENSPINHQEAVAARKRMKRKSKRNVKARLEIVNHEALYEVEMKETTIEWSSDFDKGSLVETRDGDIGIVMEQYDVSHNRVTKPAHIKTAMLNSYVRVLVNGEVQWHTKVSVSSLSDG
jgi:hypothetical protein